MATAPIPLSPDGSQVVIGPFLGFHHYAPSRQQWHGSVLLLARSDVCPDSPTLHVQAPGSYEATVQGVYLDAFNGWNFWRFDVVVACGPEERAVEYWLTAPGQDEYSNPSPHFTFHVPGTNQPWNWGFYSCNGFHDANNEVEAGGIGPMWADVLAYHRQRPFHLMVGGGDQLYNDPVWKVPSLEAWTKDTGDEERHLREYSSDMSSEVDNFYFTNYFRQWTQPGFSEALATIPMIMTWDDHEVFDGWGSYPDKLHSCRIFQGVFRSARHFYALFQQHAHPDNDNNPFRLNGAFGAEGGWHSVTCLGPSLALVMLDCRMERNQAHIVHPNSYAQVQARLLELPDSIRHVAVVASVPLIYPEIPTSEGVFGALSAEVDVPSGGFLGRLGGLTKRLFGNQFSMSELLMKTGLAEGLINQFGYVDLLDDVQDHWGSHLRRSEKIQLVHMMQGVTAARGCRFTLLGGDVHLAAVGRFVTKSGPNPEEDCRFIPQLTSSAIGNIPPPGGVVQVLSRVDSRMDVDEVTEEYMVTDVFNGDMLMPHRNWLMAREQPSRMGGDDSVYYQFRVENDQYGSGMREEVYQLTVPPLRAGVDPSAAPLVYPAVEAPPSYFADQAAVVA